MNTMYWADIQQVKKDVWIFDIDGTLADHQGIRSPFDESKVSLDRPIEPVFKVLRSLIKDYKVIFVSGRSEKCRQDTHLWLWNGLAELNIPPDLIDILEIYMRQTGDNRKDSIVKKEIYDRDILPNYNIIGVFDDRLQVCRMLYENNIFCFNVNQGLREF